MQENNTTAAATTTTKSNSGSNTGESYRPSRGSWGYFERPKDISKAYGGGKRVGAGVTVDEESRLKAEEENASEIEEAINLASLANQRGMYATTVSCLEKVTKYCSTNSKVGGTVFLELAMAYEAIGRTNEAITVYSALSKSPIERV